jgi:hypothetical protein
MSVEERGLFNEHQLGFRALQSMTLNCVRLRDPVGFTFNRNTCIAEAFLGKETYIDTN